MEKWESVKMLHHSANISERILFDEDGAQRSDEKIRFILNAVNQAVQVSIKPSLEDFINIISKMEGKENNA